MEKDRDKGSRADFRHLPPRITPDEMIPLQPVVHIVHDPREGGSDNDWHIRMGWTG